MENKKSDLDEAISAARAKQKAQEEAYKKKQLELTNFEEIEGSFDQKEIIHDVDASAPHFDDDESTITSFVELDVPLLDFAWKDDIESMESPVFTLTPKSRKRQETVAVFANGGRREILITESHLGRATIFDKDILIFCTSMLMQAMNKGKEISPRVTFYTRQFLKATGRRTGGDEYIRFSDAITRLHGTLLLFADDSPAKRRRGGEGIISKWSVCEHDGGRAVIVDVTLSPWIYNAIKNKKVLTINKDYFKLRKPLERRLYEIARKHCGKQAQWWIGWDQLHVKCGALEAMRNFKISCKAIAKANRLPDYMMMIVDDGIGFTPKTYPSIE